MKLFNFSNKRVYWIETDAYDGYSFWWMEPFGIVPYEHATSYLTKERCEEAAIQHYNGWSSAKKRKAGAGKFIKEIINE